MVKSMSSLEKKTSLKKKTLRSTTNPPLPDDLLVSCLALISKLYYPTLSLVSKRFQSLIASPGLYQTRSSLNRTESCLYVGFWSEYRFFSRWFTLCRKPDQTLNNDTKSSGYVLAALPSENSVCAHSSGYVALGTNIYKIGCSFYGASSSVLVLDCGSNTWREAPSMQVERLNRRASSVFDGKIYVGGGCKERNPATWMEVFDPKTQTWEFVPGPKEEILDFDLVDKSAVIGGTIYYGNQEKILGYKPKEGKWGREVKEMTTPWAYYCYCVIDNVLYHFPYYSVEIQWYDIKARSWRKVNMTGKGLPQVARYYGITMADYGGKMVVLWETSYTKEKLITCAVIKLERSGNEEIRGKIEWCDQVLTVPESFYLAHAITATL